MLVYLLVNNYSAPKLLIANGWHLVPGLVVLICVNLGAIISSILVKRGVKIKHIAIFFIVVNLGIKLFINYLEAKI